MIFLAYIPFIILVSILVHGEVHKNIKKIRIFKPICSLLLIVLIVFGFFVNQPDPLLFAGILIAMLFSFGGDISLMFQDNRKFFLIGLVLFLLGHISYGITFTILSGFIIWDLVSAAGLGFLFILLFSMFRSGSGDMLKSVIAYMLIISFMMNRAVSTAFSDSFTTAQIFCIIAGSALFYISDVILAWNRFYKPFKYHRFSLLFYYSGQFLIISSLFL